MALLIDDDENVRETTAEMLTEFGYRTITAVDATAALAMLGAVGVDLVVTDIVMPGKIDGVGLVEIINAFWPTTKVVCVSDFAPDPERLAAVCTNFLMKPYTYSQLAKAVRDSA